MIILKKSDYEAIAEHAKKGLPNEACGLLGGTIEGDKKYIKKVYLLKNADNSPEHFSMIPDEQFAAVRDMRKNDLVLIGNFHSHPSSPSRPSEEDKRLAFDPDISYLILSLQNKGQVLNSFLIKNNKVTREELVIE